MLRALLSWTRGEGQIADRCCCCGLMQTHECTIVAAWGAATVAAAAASAPTATAAASAVAPSLLLRHSVPVRSLHSPHHVCCAPPHRLQLRQVSSTHLPALGSALSLSMNSQSLVSASSKGQ